jgi:large subunit ribosomal protein L17
MRHRKAGRKLGMNASARKAMFRNMVTSLMEHGQIRTTQAKAKELRRFAERVISIGKRCPSTGDLEGLSDGELRSAKANRVAAIRRARVWVNNDEAMSKIFGEYADRFRERPGGYTRVVKLGTRAGDNAPMAMIMLVDEAYVPSEPKKAAPVKAEETVAVEQESLDDLGGESEATGDQEASEE